MAAHAAYRGAVSSFLVDVAVEEGEVVDVREGDDGAVHGQSFCDGSASVLPPRVGTRTSVVQSLFRGRLTSFQLTAWLSESLLI